MNEAIAQAKDILIFANLVILVLVVPLYKFIKNSIHTNIELSNTIKELKEELGLLRAILFEVADGEVIKKHIAKIKNERA